MEYGCIGEKLGHSFSKEIHNALADYKYELKELTKAELHSFMEKHEFKAINVTIPYKEQVIPYLYSISEEAKKIGAVNTIVNIDGKLYGYNTDFFGMKALIKRAEIEIENKTVAILGGGGTAKTAFSVAESMGAKNILRVSRSEKDGFITYDKLYEKSDIIDVLINTTPVGMYPEIFTSPVDVECFKGLSGVVDAVYNPLRSKLVFDAQKRGIKAVGGLYMLVAQAAAAVEKFISKEVSAMSVESVFKRLFSEKENIVLIGMPSSGKSSVGNALSKKLNRQFFDSDALIVESEGADISDIFAKKGELYFRECEAREIYKLSKNNASVIATGGGVVLNENNIELLKENGRIFFLDRELQLLVATNDRPLSSSKEALEKRYKERYDLYKTAADEIINANGTVEEVTNQILKVIQ